ncbi:MAG: ATP-binding protein [Proteobacteria bacterium]|nr:ATP-binding protein [Pseudomonadota bacterium]
MKNIYKHFLKVYILFFIGIIFAIFISSFFIEKIYLKSSLNRLKDITKRIINIIGSIEDKEKHNLLKDLAQINSIRITIIKDSGEIIFDSHSDPKTMENHLNREEVAKSLKDGEGTSIRLSNTLGTKMLYYSKKITLNNKTYIFRTSGEISDLFHFIRPYKNSFVITSSGLFLIIFSLAFFYFRNFAKKMDSLQSAIAQISKGDFDASINIERNDVLYPIAKNVKILAYSIKTLTEDIKSQKELLSNILENLPFPVVIAHENKEMLVENRFFRESFPNVRNVEQLANLIRDENFYNAIKLLDKEFTNVNIEIQWKEKFFSIFGNKVSYQNHTLILLSFIDITEIKKTEKMKADFTANVSHELKTPITVLKGYIETLEEEIEESKKPIVKILKRHIDRLSNLVSDVLLLSRLDAKVPIEKETFDFAGIILSALDIFNTEILNKNIKVQTKLEENLKYYGDSFLIFQALINLISNAIKFTPQNGDIEIEAQKKYESLIFSIKDNGPGIPKEYQDRIFQRFFVIDKSRSRQLGGTGLGLSIVKHIVELHGGKISVESEYGKGAKFIVTLPVSNE